MCRTEGSLVRDFALQMQAEVRRHKAERFKFDALAYGNFNQSWVNKQTANSLVAILHL